MRMHRRACLACLAGALAGCSSGGNAGRRSDETVTPAPVPDGRSAPVTAAGELAPAATGDAHVEALSGGSARFAAEYLAGRAEQPFDLARILATVDGGAFTYRRFDIRELDRGTVTRTFKGIWYEDGEAVGRFFDGGNQSLQFEAEEFAPPPAVDRYDRERVVALLSAFAPAVTAVDGGYEMAADGVAAPARLPIPEGLDGSENGRLRGRVGDDGVVTELSALFGVPPSRAGSDPAPITYRLAVTDRGSTVVERPDAEETLEWYRRLKNESPVPADAAQVERPDW